MKQYAEIDDYVRRYGDPDDILTLDEVLKDATREIDAMLEMHNLKPRRDEEYKARLMQVCRDMAHRAMQVSTNIQTIPYGATQYTQSADGYSEQFGFNAAGGSGYGELYLTKSEKRLLGIGKQRIGSIAPERRHGCKVHR